MKSGRVVVSWESTSAWTCRKGSASEADIILAAVTDRAGGCSRIVELDAVDLDSVQGCLLQDAFAVAQGYLFEYGRSCYKAA